MAKKAKTMITFQDVIHYATRFVKYGKLAVILFMAGIAGSLLFYTYGQPTYYSRSQVAFSNLTLPIQSETGDAGGKGRYAQISFMLISGLNSRWLVEQTAKKIGLVAYAGQYEEIRDKYVPKIIVSMLPGSLLQVEVWAYQPWLVKTWPEVMLQAYRESTVEARARHREMASETYTEEMNKLRQRINEEQNARVKFEEDNRLIEQYIDNNSLEGVPSEMLTIKSRLDMMQQVEEMLANPVLTQVDKLALLERFKGAPVPVGTIMRRGAPDSLVSRGITAPGSTTTSLTSDSPTMPSLPTTPIGETIQPARQAPMVVVPSMVEELAPWESTEKSLRAALFEREQMAKTYLPGHEKMRALDKRIGELTASMNNELVTAQNAFRLERSQLEAKLGELQKKMPDYRRVLNDFDRYKKEYSLMAGGNLMWEQAYADLQKRLAAMEYTGIEMKVDFEFKGFTYLRDEEPISPNKSKLLTYALILGIGCAGGTCFMLEQFRSTTSLVVETEKMTGLNALGVVPSCPSSALEPFRETSGEDEVHLSETFRIIRCSIPLHVPADNPCQVIMVTSARPSEGKTTMSSLLCRSFADAGLKTLWIDGDLRRGRVHRMLPDEQNAGLAGFLTKQVPSIDDVIIKAPVEGLDVITRGKGSFSKFEALSNRAFREMIQEMRRRYDRIIIDNPPLLGLADALMISESVDGVVMVIRADQTTQRDVRTALEILSGTKTPVYGFVLNGVDLSKLENYYYYSSYYPKYYDPSYTQLADA